MQKVQKSFCPSGRRARGSLIGVIIALFGICPLCEIWGLGGKHTLSRTNIPGGLDDSLWLDTVYIPGLTCYLLRSTMHCAQGVPAPHVFLNTIEYILDRYKCLKFSYIISVPVLNFRAFDSAEEVKKLMYLPAYPPIMCWPIWAGPIT